MGETQSRGSKKEDKDDFSGLIRVNAQSWSGEAAKLHLQPISYLGKGAFGTVKKMLLMNEDTGERGYVAMKNPLGPPRLNAMEKAILLVLRHQNVCNMLYFFNDKMDHSHLILEFVEGGDLFQYMRTNYVPNIGLGPYLELFSYQLWRAIAYLHANAIIHRDLKPENLLVNPELGTLKLTDFGCSVLLREEDMDKEMIFYIGTLVFRAPEMILGARRYSAKSDIWGAAVVMTEMVLGQPIFYNAVGPKGHMKKIMEHLGYPTEEDFDDMRVEPVECPTHMKKLSIKKRLKRIKLPPPSDKKMLAKLLQETIVFSPNQRPTAWEVLVHPFFRCLQEPDLTLPNGNPYPELFNFTQFEVESMPEAVRANLNMAY